MTTTVQHWSGLPVVVARSKGGVWAFCDLWDNFLRSVVPAWPPPELVQKLYESRQARAFEGDELTAVTAQLGYYCDLQSVHSEDAVTWNLFGPLVYGAQHDRDTFTRHLLRLLQIPGAQTDHTTIWLWRRIPHPDSRVPGGPEIDFGLLAGDTLVLGEAKWQSSVGQRQGVAVARAAAFGSKVVILDEPTAALGVKESRKVLDLIQDVRARGVPIILISHNMPHVFEVADRIHIHRLGRRLCVINPKDYTMSDAVAFMTGAKVPEGVAEVA